MTALEWEGCLNVRDLGGLPTGDGRRTRRGSVIRADNVRMLTAAGWRAFAEHDVGRIVDLRWPEEKVDEPPLGVEIDVVHVSVLGESIDHEYFAGLDENLDSVEDVADHYALSYVDFLERYRERFGRALAAIADADPERPVVVHCFGGKDRTGLISALLLRLAGVERSTIGDDYSQSAPNLAPREASWLSRVEGIERERRRKLSDTPAEAMVRVLEEIEQRYGDVEGYLRAAGLTGGEIERLRARLAPA